MAAPTRSDFYGRLAVSCLLVLALSIVPRGSAQGCTTVQEGCAVAGDACSLFSSGELACTQAESGYFLFRNDLVQECTAVEGAESVSCEAFDDSRAVCRETIDLVQHHTDNTGRGMSDTCTPCIAPPEDECVEPGSRCMVGTCTPSTSSGSDASCAAAEAECTLDWTGDISDAPVEADCPPGGEYTSHASVCEGTAGCAYTPPTYRQCIVPAAGYYTDSKHQAQGEPRSTHRAHRLAATCLLLTHGRRTLRSVRRGGERHVSRLLCSG